MNHRRFSNSNINANKDVDNRRMTNGLDPDFRDGFDGAQVPDMLEEFPNTVNYLNNPECDYHY